MANKPLPLLGAGDSGHTVGLLFAPNAFCLLPLFVSADDGLPMCRLWDDAGVYRCRAWASSRRFRMAPVGANILPPRVGWCWRSALRTRHKPTASVGEVAPTLGCCDSVGVVFRPFSAMAFAPQLLPLRSVVAHPAKSAVVKQICRTNCPQVFGADVLKRLGFRQQKCWRSFRARNAHLCKGILKWRKSGWDAEKLQPKE